MWAGQNSPHICTVEKLGPTEGPNISTVLVFKQKYGRSQWGPNYPNGPNF